MSGRRRYLESLRPHGFGTGALLPLTSDQSKLLTFDFNRASSTKSLSFDQEPIKNYMHVQLDYQSSMSLMACLTCQTNVHHSVRFFPSLSVHTA